MKRNKMDSKSKMNNKNCNSKQNNVSNKSSNNISSKNQNNITDSKKSMGFNNEE